MASIMLRYNDCDMVEIHGISQNDFTRFSKFGEIKNIVDLSGRAYSVISLILGKLTINLFKDGENG